MAKAKPLTDFAVKNYKPGKQRREIPDGGCLGLRLVVQPSGHKSWAMRFRKPNGAPYKLTLGPVDLSGRKVEGEPAIGQLLTLARARRLAAAINDQRASGRDVAAEYKADTHRRKSQRESRAASTFAAAATDFIEQYAKKKTRGWKEQARLLGLKPMPDGSLEVIAKGLAESWADKPVADIDGHDIYGVVEETRVRGVPGTVRRSDGPTEVLARNMFACLSKMFGWLQQHRRVEKNPCAGVHKPEAPKARDRVLTDAEIVKFWSATETERREFRDLLRLLLLTGCRLNEVAGMTRAELSDDGETWNLPGERTKNHRPHVVPLPSLARQMITGEGALVFTTDGKNPISIGSKIKARLDERMSVPPWRFHDLRRTAATGMAEIGIAPHIVEACLNHISGARAGVAGTYNRAAYAAEKKAALERWADHVAGLVSGKKAKVVQLRGRRSR